MNILFTCAGRRNYLINYFKEALNRKGLIYAADMQLTAPALIDADRALILPSIYDSKYISSIIEYIKEKDINAIISLNDLELPILSKNRSKVEKAGARLLVSNENIIDICFDKWKTHLYLLKCGLKSPLTYISYREAISAIDKGNLSFPLVLKPRWGSASIGIEFPNNFEELELTYKLLNVRLRRSILADASQNDINNAILIQEKISGDEYGMDVLNDLKGNYKGSFVRKKIAMRSGETDKAESIIDHRFEKVGYIIGSNLKHIGNLDCDVLKKDNELHVLELNPRFGGGYPFSHEAGINTAKCYIDWLRDIDSFEHNNNYKSGIIFSKCDRLLKVN